MPKYLTIEDNKSEVKVHIQNQRIKMYLMKEMDMVNTIDSISAKIWGKCTDPLHNMIKYIEKFTVNHKGKDAIRLLKNLNTVSIEIDYLGSKHVNYFNALEYFVNMRQGPLEEYNG